MAHIAWEFAPAPEPLKHLDTLKNTSVYFNGFEDVCTNVCIESVPFHPGAARALKEAGYWKDTFTVYGE